MVAGLKRDTEIAGMSVRLSTRIIELFRTRLKMNLCSHWFGILAMAPSASTCARVLPSSAPLLPRSSHSAMYPLWEPGIPLSGARRGETSERMWLLMWQRLARGPAQGWWGPVRSETNSSDRVKLLYMYNRTYTCTKKGD